MSSVPTTWIAGLPAAWQLAVLQSSIDFGKDVLRLLPTALPQRSVGALNSPARSASTKNWAPEFR